MSAAIRALGESAMEITSAAKIGSKWIAIAASIVGALTAVSTALISTSVKDTKIDIAPKVTEAKLLQLEDRLASLERLIQQISKTTSDGGPGGGGSGGGSPPSLQVPKLEAELRVVKDDLANFKQLVLKEPETVLTLPLIKKDIEQLKENNTQVRTDVSNMADLGKWFIGSLITIALGLFSLMVTIVLKGKNS